jgi:hypothetical protein
MLGNLQLIFLMKESRNLVAMMSLAYRKFEIILSIRLKRLRQLNLGSKCVWSSQILSCGKLRLNNSKTLSFLCRNFYRRYP